MDQRATGLRKVLLNSQIVVTSTTMMTMGGTRQCANHALVAAGAIGLEP